MITGQMNSKRTTPRPITCRRSSWDRSRCFPHTGPDELGKIISAWFSFFFCFCLFCFAILFAVGLKCWSRLDVEWEERGLRAPAYNEMMEASRRSMMHTKNWYGMSWLWILWIYWMLIVWIDRRMANGGDVNKRRWGLMAMLATLVTPSR